MHQLAPSQGLWPHSWLGRGPSSDGLGATFPISNSVSPSPAENLSFWEACEELRYGEQSRIPEIVDSIYQ